MNQIMRLISVLFALTLIPSITLAQTEYNATVVDRENPKEHLPFASISVNGESRTISNELGQFFLIGNEEDVVKVSYVGYESATFHLGKMPEVIRLKPYSVELKEVVAIPLNKIIDKFIESHLAEIEKYKNNTSTFFYRQTTSTSGETNEFIEAFLNAKSAIALRDVSIINGRYAALKSTAEHFYSNMTDYWTLSQVPPISKTVKKKSRFVIIPFTPLYKKYYDADYSIATDNKGNTLYKITMTPKKAVKRAIIKGTIWVDADDMRLLRYSGTFLNSHATNYDTKKETPLYTSFDCTYTHTNGFTEVSSIKTTSSYEHQGHKVKASSILFNVGNKHWNGKKKIKGHDNFKYKISSVKYDPKFWQDNTIIKRTPLEEGVLKMFEKEGLFSNYK